MTDAQIFQLLGVVYLTIGIGILTAPQFYKRVITSFMENGPAYYLGGLVALVVGFLLVSFHNTWVKDWPVIITIIGWIALFKGILLLAFPQIADKITKRFIAMKNYLTIWAVIVIILGVLCSWLGFFVMRKPII